MRKSSAAETALMETALLASHALLATPVNRFTARPQPPPPINNISSSFDPSTPKPQTQPKSPTPPTPPTPATPRLPVTPIALCEPRKRSLFEYDSTSEPMKPKKRTRTTPTTPVKTPSKSSRGRKKKSLPLDRVICIPMHVLRAQKDDTSALLRPPPRPSDLLRKLVDLNVEKTLEKIRASGATGILNAAVWLPSKSGGTKKVNAATGSPMTKAGRVKKTSLNTDDISSTE